MNSEPTLISELNDDNLFVISQYLAFNDIISVSLCNNDLNKSMKQARIWDILCKKYFKPSKNINNSKKNFAEYIEKYGSKSIVMFKQITRLWKLVTRYFETYYKDILKTFKDPLSKDELLHFKTKIESGKSKGCKIPTDYLIFIGECCSGQINAEILNNKFSYGAKRALFNGFYGYYSFYNYNGSSFLLDTNGIITQESILNNSFKNYDKMLLFAGSQSGTVPNFTFLRLTDGKIVKKTSDQTVIDNLPYNESFGAHLTWYVGELMKNHFRITKKGILRFILKDDTHNTVGISNTGNIITRSSPLFIPEMSVTNKRYVFPYRIEIECPDENTSCPRGVLTTRQWRIKKDNTNNIDTVNGPGVIGLYPQVYPGQSLFGYQSCVHQKIPNNCWMEGSFQFIPQNPKNNGDMFELEIARYTTDINKSQWI